MTADEIKQLRTINQKLKTALSALVGVNEQWNATVEEIIGRPSNWTDIYLDRAREALKDATVIPVEVRQQLTPGEVVDRLMSGGAVKCDYPNVAYTLFPRTKGRMWGATEPQARLDFYIGDLHVFDFLHDLEFGKWYAVEDGE